MEYGIISDPAANWTSIIIGLACIMAALIIVGLNEYHMAAKKQRENTSINNWETRNIIAIVFAIFLFVFALITIVGGCAAGIGRDTLDPEYASENAYRIVEAHLVYYADNQKDSKGLDAKDKNGNVILIPQKPAYFIIRLEGRAGKNLPSDVRIVRWFKIPYDMVSQNYKFTPEMPKTGDKLKLVVPEYIIKYAGDFWKFSETGPE